MANEENLQRDIATLERALREAAKQADTVQSALDDLEGHRNELAGRLAIARQAASDYEARLEERRQELARALEAQAQAKLLEAVGERDDAANRAVEAILQLIASFERLDAAREKVIERVAEAQTHLGRRPEVALEPEKLELEWARLIAFVRERAQLALDIELVEAAVSSPLGHEIEKLPEHLQVIARRRWQEQIRSARAGTGHHNRD
jgi:chromosome segregation ATPase